MTWRTSLLSNVIGFCKTSFRIELITNPIILLSIKFWIPISFKIQKGHRAPWFHCGCEDKENRRWDSCRWGRHRRLWGYDGWEMLHWAETKVHHKICQGKGYIQHADEMHVCVCVIMIIKITSLHNFSSYLHQCKTNTCIPYSQNQNFNCGCWYKTFAEKLWDTDKESVSRCAKQQWRVCGHVWPGDAQWRVSVGVDLETRGSWRGGAREGLQGSQLQKHLQET